MCRPGSHPWYDAFEKGGAACHMREAQGRGWTGRRMQSAVDEIAAYTLSNGRVRMRLQFAQGV